MQNTNIVDRLKNVKTLAFTGILCTAALLWAASATSHLGAKRMAMAGVGKSSQPHLLTQAALEVPAATTAVAESYEVVVEVAEEAEEVSANTVQVVQQNLQQVAQAVAAVTQDVAAATKAVANATAQAGKATLALAGAFKAAQTAVATAQAAYNAVANWLAGEHMNPADIDVQTDRMLAVSEL